MIPRLFWTSTRFATFCFRGASRSRTCSSTIRNGKFFTATNSAFCWREPVMIRPSMLSASIALFRARQHCRRLLPWCDELAWFPAREIERRETNMAVHRRYDIIGHRCARDPCCAVCFDPLRIPPAFDDAGGIFRCLPCAGGKARCREEDRRGILEVRRHPNSVAVWLCSSASRRTAGGVFRHRSAEAGSAANDSAVRARYWQKLRGVWGVSTVWHKQYEWNTISLTQSLQSAGQWLESHMRRIVGYLVAG